MGSASANTKDKGTLPIALPELERVQLASYVAIQLPLGWQLWGARHRRGLGRPTASLLREPQVRAPDRLARVPCGGRSPLSPRLLRQLLTRRLVPTVTRYLQVLHSSAFVFGDADAFAVAEA